MHVSSLAVSQATPQPQLVSLLATHSPSQQLSPNEVTGGKPVPAIGAVHARASGPVPHTQVPA